ncbi:MAG TPA: PrsW family glutamic-type intramembrane protease [Polyangiaceae bacterium]
MRTRPLTTIVLLILAVAFAAGWVTDGLVAHGRSPVERARELAGAGHADAAEQAYLDLAAQHPGDLELVIELVDNHVRLEHGLMVPAMMATGQAPRLAAPAEESRIDAVVSAPALGPDGILLAGWWRHFAEGEEDFVERERVTAAADREPPAPWANHLLGRALQEEGERPGAADRFAREAASFDGRAEDASEACEIWVQEGAGDRLHSALGVPTFARQVPAIVRFEDALHRRDWVGAARWFFPTQYEHTTLGVLLLAGLAGLVWFVICATIGRVGQRPALRVPLYVAAFALGVASTYAAVAGVIVEEDILHFTEKGQALDIIYFVLGVGLREESCKALLLLPLVPIVRRWGTRREALACGALVGLGFAAEENLGYFQHGLSAGLSRFLTANFLHLSTTGLVAVAIDDAMRGTRATRDSWTQVFPLVVITHGVYDFFLSSRTVEMASFVSMFVFVLLARRFADVIRELPGREGPLFRYFVVGLALVTGGSFVYAASIVGVAHAATAIVGGMLGVAIMAYIFGRELGSV